MTAAVAPILGPHLVEAFAQLAPQVVAVLERMWLPVLTSAVVSGEVDVAITCGLIPEPDGVVSEVFCAEPLLVGLRHEHRLAGAQSVSLEDLRYNVLGGPSVELADTDLTAARWADQPGIDWIMLTGSLADAHTRTVIKTVRPDVEVPYTLQWSPDRANSTAVSRFMHATLSVAPPRAGGPGPATSEHVQSRGVFSRAGCSVARGVQSRGLSTQNSLPSGSASTTHVESPCPTSTGVAPRPTSRDTSAA
jgi:DNA-binding transcriptional LysR family regulator